MHTREDSGLFVDRHQQWWHDGERIEHPKIVEAFEAGLQPTEDGRYKLCFGWDWCYVQVEDAAYRVKGVEPVPETGTLRGLLSDGTSEVLDPAGFEVDREGAIVSQVKGGRARARFTRDAQAELGSHLEEREGRLHLRVGGRSVELPAELSLP